MNLPNLAVFPLVLLVAGVAAAQSSPASPVSPVTSTVRLPHLDSESPCSWPGVICDTFGAPAHQPVSPSAIKPFQGAPLDFRPFRQTFNLGASSPTCYKLRAYEYTVTNPHTGQIRWTGMATCQPATNFRMRSAAWTGKR
jgi:hypothetical protein